MTHLISAWWFCCWLMSEKHTFRSVWEAAESSIKGMNPETDCLGSNPCFFYFLLAVWPWTDCLTSLCFSFLISKIRIMILIAYGEWYWIRDIRRRFSFGNRDQGPGLITQELLCSRVLLKRKRTKKASEIGNRRGIESAPSLVMEKGVIYFFNWLLQ